MRRGVAPIGAADLTTAPGRLQMDAYTFDRWTVAMTQRPSRRLTMRILAGGLLGALLAQRGAKPAVAQDPTPVIDVLPPLYLEPEDSCIYMGLSNCFGSCVDLETDWNNCGGCGVVCGSGGGCFGGTCVAPPPSSPCGAGLTTCGGECVSISKHAGHCGACFNSCPLGGYCHRGRCCANGQCL
jgi:hypothetical protein